MLDANTLFMVLRIAAGLVAVSFIVFWVGLVWWVSQDVLTRTNDKIIIAAAVAMTAILGPVGVMFYLIIRPKQTLKESYGEMMEHEMMLRAASSAICPMCDHMTQEDFVNCPYCGTVLKQQCVGCHKLVSLDWSFCPYCGHVSESHLKKPSINAAGLKESYAKSAGNGHDSRYHSDVKAGESVRQVQSNSLTSAITRPLVSSRHIMSQAGQSAISLLKQTLSPSPVISQGQASQVKDSPKQEVEQVSETQSSHQPETKTPTVAAKEEVTTSENPEMKSGGITEDKPSPRKTAAKRRTTRRVKK